MEQYHLSCQRYLRNSKLLQPAQRERLTTGRLNQFFCEKFAGFC
jgi:hypothetical protein